MIRLMAEILALIAVLLMPLGMTAAPAAVAHQGRSAGMPMQHCPEQAPRHEKKSGFDECTMACSAALPAADSPQEALMLIASVPNASAATPMLHGVHPDIATPPPKDS
jgi:hypothetical protein